MLLFSTLVPALWAWMVPPAAAAAPLPASVYAFAPAEAAQDRGQIIDLDLENTPAFSALYQGDLPEPEFLIVPGFSSKRENDPPPLQSKARARLKLAHRYFERTSVETFFIVSGGNVAPTNTPYNEAMEMKRYLMNELGVPEERILIEPYARNTVTNLRNTGRLLLAMGVRHATVITSFWHSLYIAKPEVSTLAPRARALLGGFPGRTELISWRRVRFRPHSRVFTPGPDPLDP